MNQNPHNINSIFHQLPNYFHPIRAGKVWETLITPISEPTYISKKARTPPQFATTLEFLLVGTSDIRVPTLNMSYSVCFKHCNSKRHLIKHRMQVFAKSKMIYLPPSFLSKKIVANSSLCKVYALKNCIRYIAYSIIDRAGVCTCTLKLHPLRASEIDNEGFYYVSTRLCLAASITY